MRRARVRSHANPKQVSPTDPDAPIARLMGGRTRLASKAKNTVDRETKAIVASILSAATPDGESVIHSTSDDPAPFRKSTR